MKLVTGIALALLVVSFVACEKDDAYDPYPVWVLYTHVVEEVSDIGIPQAPVRGCPQIVFRTLPGGRDSTVNCMQPGSNVVKVWDHIDSTVTIQYYVRCNNYYDSDIMTRTFYAENAYQRPGRDGAEDMVVETVVLLGR